MADWEIQDKGWHTSEIGGVADEGGRKWYFYPVFGHERYGPYPSMKEAIRQAEQIAAAAHA